GCPARDRCPADVPRGRPRRALSELGRAADRNLAARRAVRRGDEQCRPQVRTLPHRLGGPNLGDRPRPHVPRRAQAPHRDRGLPALALLALPLVVAPSPSPTPQPVVHVSPTSGPPGISIDVSGQSFPPNQQVGLFFDSPINALGSTLTGGDGSLNANGVTIPDSRPGPHTICAAVSVDVNPCAQFQVTAPPPTSTPTPPPTPTPSPSDTGTPSPSPSASSSPSTIGGTS